MSNPNSSNSKDNKWVVSQKWSDVLFLTYAVPFEVIRELVPKELEIDTFDGEAFVSIVPFFMSDVRFKVGPVLPFSKLWELNLRTYVKFKNRKGIYFLTLDANHFLGSLIANLFFHLPYRYRNISGMVNNQDYSFSSKESLNLDAKIGKLVRPSDFDEWAVERYSLYTKYKSRIYRGDVSHKKWELYEIEELDLRDNFSSEFNLSSKKKILHQRYSKKLDVKFKPFRIVSGN